MHAYVRVGMSWFMLVPLGFCVGVLLWSSLDPVKAVHADSHSEATEEEPQEDEEVAETSPAPVRKGSRKSQVLLGSRCY